MRLLVRAVLALLMLVVSEGAATILPLENLVEILKRAETAPPFDGTVPLATGVASLRKLVYDSQYWDMLFPSAASTSKAEVGSGGGLTAEDVAVLSTGNLLLEVPSHHTAGAAAATPAGGVAGGGETEVLDTNHVWVGIEAVGAPPASTLLKLLGISSITGVTTWSGDLASAVAEKYAHANGASGSSNYGCTDDAAAAANTTVIECYLAVLADHADLRSDVDGIALGAVIMATEQANTTAVPLSAHVESYYSSDGGSKCRVSAAARVLGWTWAGHGKFTAETLSAIAASIAADADVFVKQSEGCPSNIGACLTAKCSDCGDDVAAAVAYGVGWFESEREAELGRGCSAGDSSGSDGGDTSKENGLGSCGEHLVGWSGPGEGRNGCCNTCTCMEEGMACTEMACSCDAASHATALLYRPPYFAFMSITTATLLAAISTFL